MAIHKAKPIILSTPKADQKARSFTIAGWEKSLEVSMLGVTASDSFLEELNRARGFTPKVNYYILDWFPVKQECSGTYTEMDNEAVWELREKLVEMGYPMEQQNAHAHTHPDMTTAPSAIDEKHIEAYAPDKSLVTIIMNEKYALDDDPSGINTRVDIWSPVRHTFTNTSTIYRVDAIPVIPDDWGRKAFEEYVTKSAPVVHKVNLPRGKAYYPYSNHHQWEWRNNSENKWSKKSLHTGNDIVDELYNEGSITKGEAEKLALRVATDPGFTEGDLHEELDDLGVYGSWGAYTNGSTSSD